MSGIIYCYGDSNTWGFDPRGLMAYRYPEESRWVDILIKEGLPLVNGGMNGRTIPVYEGEKRLLLNTLKRFRPKAMSVMLGTNDLLTDPRRRPEDVAASMDTMLDMVQNAYPKLGILLIAPVPVEVAQWDADKKSGRLSLLYERIANRRGIRFADAAEWKIPLSFDGVHFTEEGHRTFARKAGQFFTEDAFLVNE
jgi:lysophospholipase L1-like esterase